MAKIDLHMHSTASDGKLSSKELIDLALEKNIQAIAITDHDRIDSVQEALDYSKEKKVEVISGVELTSDPEGLAGELHIVGLFVDHKNDIFNKIREKGKLNSIENAKEMIGLLQEEGYDISFEELEKKTGAKHFGRPFIAEILLEKYPEEFKDRKEVFEKLLGKKGKAFILPRAPSLKETISAIHSAKGVAILAHPWYLGDNFEKALKKFLELGGDGVEVDAPDKPEIPKDFEGNLRKIVKEKNLVVSGGTDFHYLEEGGKELGDRGITLEEFNSLKEFWKNKYNQNN